MTNITQEDREAAARYLQEHSYGKSAKFFAEMRAGSRDVSLTVQAFARHREAAFAAGEAAERARVVAILREFGAASVHLILSSGLPGGTRTQRTKAAAHADGFSKAVSMVKSAIEAGQHKEEG